MPRLLAAVDAAFATTAEGMVRWSDPHPHREPLEEEYSRCLDPHRYRIVLARGDAWVAALEELDLAHPRSLPPRSDLWRDQPTPNPPDRVVLLEPTLVPDAAPLLLAFWRGSHDAVPQVVVGAGRPAAQVGGSPVCGCDACDGGSAEHLNELDDAVLDVVTGGWIQVVSPEATVSANRSGWSASGDDLRHVDTRRLLDDARRGHSAHPVVCTTRWW